MTSNVEDVPNNFDGLELLWRLGQTASGPIYRARDAKLGKDVAVHFGVTDAPEGLEHPFIVQIFRTGTVGDRSYTVVELVEGETLAELRAGHRISPRRSVEAMEKIARALDYAHGRGFVHRGLTAADIVLDKADVPEVTGFRRRAPEDDSREDIRAVGDILRELAGKDMAPDLRTIVERCVDPDRDLRYETAKELAEDLNHHLEGRPVTLRRAPRLLEKAKRYRRPLALAGGGLAVAAMLLLYRGSREAEKPKPKESTPAEEAERLYAESRRAKDEEEALTLLSKAIHLAPAAAYHAARAELHDKAGRDAAAALDLARALELDAKHGPAMRLSRKREARRLGEEARAADDARALEILAKALELDPENAMLLLERGKRLGRQRKYAEALGDLSRALGLDGSLAEARILQQDFRAALEEQRRPKPKKQPLTTTEQADLQLEAGKAASARDWEQVDALMAEALERGPVQAWMHAHLAAARLGKGKPGEALRHVEAAIQAEPEERSHLLIRGDVHLELGEARKAAADFRGYAGGSASLVNQHIKDARVEIEARPSDPRPLVRRGAFYYIKRNFEPALRDFADALRLGDRRALFWRALAHEGEGRTEDARADVEEFLKTYPLEDARQFKEELR